VLLLILSALLYAHAERKPNQKSESESVPAVRISVAPLGYSPPSAAYMSYRFSSASLSFLDADHLLFTFRTAGLLKRLPDDPPEDEDQNIHAVVLNIATGKAEREIDWRMHDHERYLWMLSGGRFLVRVRNALFLSDSSLQLNPYLASSTKLRAVQLSPDRSRLLVEAEKTEEPQPIAGDESAAPKKTKMLKIVILKTETREALVASESRRPVAIPMVAEGFIEAIPGKENGEWIIRQVPFKGDPKIIAEIKSACDPTITMLNGSVALTSSCSRNSGDNHQVTAVSSDGRQLWQQWWESRYVWPTYEYAENGRRFAFSSLQVNRALGTFEPVESSDVVAQMVGIFDVETGKLAFVKTATPILSAGQNYALSADGRRFAILREGAIEIYDLPPVSVPESLPAETSKR